MKYFVMIVEESFIGLFSKRDTLYNSIGATSSSYCNNLRDTLYICIERKRIKRYNIYLFTIFKLCCVVFNLILSQEALRRHYLPLHLNRQD